MSTSSKIVRPLVGVTVKVGLGQHLESIGYRVIFKETGVGSATTTFMGEGSAMVID